MRKAALLISTALALGLVFAACGDGEEGAGAKGGSGGSGGKPDASLDGDADADADANTCPVASFVSPKEGAKLTEADDANKDGCVDGFQYDVALAVAASDGTSVTLFGDGTLLGTKTVTAGTVTFNSVQLKSSGTTLLSAKIGTGASCEVSRSVTVTCAGAPTCDITKPTLSPTHPKLNGVPVAQGGDRVSADGSEYQAAFEVTTNVDDGQPVALTVDGSAVGLTVNATGGKAQFPGVTLVPDGDHTVVATCTPKTGVAGKSALGQFPVDSQPPDLTVSQPTDGQHFQGSTTFSVCATTTSSDAIDLPASLGSAQNNVCAAIGTSTPTCAPATAGAADSGSGGGACVDLTCPGGAPFDVVVTINDEAGNPKSTTITGVTCSSTLPSVQIVDPTTGTGSNAADHILAASSTQTKKDQDANAAGAQYSVVACTDAASGKAQLLAGPAGGSLVAIGAQVTVAAAQASDNCPAGLGYVAKFANATLPESGEDLSGQLTSATELRVDVTDVSLTTGQSPLVDVWVDTQVPVISPWNPTDLCGKHYQSATSVSVSVDLQTTSVPVAVSVTNGGVVKNYQGTIISSGHTNIGNVAFDPGSNAVVATTTEPSGNNGALQSPCAVTVGNPPIVTWVAPTSSTKFNAATDGGAAAGWQGNLSVCTDVGGVTPTPTIQFSLNGVNTGAAIPVDASGCATLPNVTVPDGDPTTITATTSNVAAKGIGSATLSPTVDTVVPSAPTGLGATVKDRRQTSFHLSWTAPADGSQGAFDYDVRVSKTSIDSTNFDSATAVSYSGTPALPGATDGVDVVNRLIETDYYFGVAALDKAGNRGPIATTGPSKATFNATTISGSVANEQFGLNLDGSASINGDALSDLIVGSQNGTAVYIYFGSASGYPSTPNVTVTGTVTGFGYSANVIGDIDADGLLDLAIASPLAGTGGRVFVFKGRTSWPPSLQESQADYVIDSTDSSFAAARLGFSIARLGDFNGDGADDFAVSGHGFNANTGRLTIVLGVTSGPFPGSVSLPAAYGTRGIKIDGNVANGRFSYSIIGGGKLNSGVGNTLITSAPTAVAGRLYAFHGQTGSAGDIPLASADATFDFPIGVTRGGTPFAQLGGLGTSNFALGTGSPTWASTPGKANIFLGNPTTGPFGVKVETFTNSLATASNDGFGNAVMGGGFSGTAVVTSFIGGPEGDVVFSGFTENGQPAKLYFYDGPHAAGLTSADVVSTADVVYPLPAGWIGCSYKSSGIKDLNGDGYGDIAVGELNVLATTYNGKVLVLW